VPRTRILPSPALRRSGNYNGFEIYDISNPAKPVLANSYLCPASQNDVSVYRNLVFMSSESTNSRTDCGFDGVPDPVSKERVRGIRVFDSRDVKHPKLVTTVQTCRGCNTHTVVTQPGNDDDVFIYVSGTAGVRSADEVPGCLDGGIDDSEQCAVPAGGHQGSAAGARAGGYRELAAHLQRSAGAAEEC